MTVLATQKQNSLNSKTHTMSPLRVAPWLLVVVAIALVLMSLAGNAMRLHDLPGGILLYELLSVDSETSLATWYSVLALSLAALLAASIGYVAWTSRQKQSALVWGAVCIVFLLLSADEGAMLHERIGRQVKMEGTFHHARWILLWLPLASVPAMILPIKLWRISRRTTIGLIIGGCVFLLGAVGVEMSNAALRAQLEAEAGTQTANIHRDHWGYIVGTHIEELLEKVGVIICIAVMARHLQLQFRNRTSGQSSTIAGTNQ